MPIQIDQSEPYLDSVDIPRAARPNDRFSVDVKLGNRSEIIAPQAGSCQSGIFGSNVAWRTPVVLYVDGSEEDRQTVCIDGSSGLKTVTFRPSLPVGEYTVSVEVLKMPDGTTAEERAGTVTVSESAPDPAVPTTGDRLTAYLEKLAAALGGTTQQVAFGMLLALALLVVL